MCHFGHCSNVLDTHYSWHINYYIVNERSSIVSNNKDSFVSDTSIHDVDYLPRSNWGNLFAFFYSIESQALGLRGVVSSFDI